MLRHGVSHFAAHIYNFGEWRRVGARFLRLQPGTYECTASLVGGDDPYEDEFPATSWVRVDAFGDAASSEACAPAKQRNTTNRGNRANAFIRFSGYRLNTQLLCAAGFREREGNQVVSRRASTAPVTTGRNHHILPATLFQLVCHWQRVGSGRQCAFPQLFTGCQ